MGYRRKLHNEERDYFEVTAEDDIIIIKYDLRLCGC
jgi:hypothetical protein